MKPQFLFFDTLPSTQLFAKEQIESFSEEELTIISAAEQTQGRGRGNHTWSSPPEGNIYSSICMVLPSNEQQKSGLISFLLALSIIESVGPLLFKWPNDLFVGQKKVGGILGETVVKGQRCWLILGFGLNVNMSQDSLRDISQAATSLKIEFGKEYDAQKLLETIIHRFLEEWKKDLNTVIDRLGQHSLFKIGDSLSLETDQGIFQGAFKGLSKEGGLILELSKGEEKTFFTGSPSAIDFFRNSL